LQAVVPKENLTGSFYCGRTHFSIQNTLFPGLKPCSWQQFFWIVL